MSKFVDSGDNLLLSFPYSLARDEDKYKLAESIADELVPVVSDTDMARILPCIDLLPEKVLDMLAYDFKVEWYEYSAPIQNKRQTIKECILVHKHKGTKYATEMAVHSLYDKAEVSEWFEYDGEPFRFRITVYGSSSNKIKTLHAKILYAKNLRSVLDVVIFVLIPDGILEMFVGGRSSAFHKKTAVKICSDDDSIFTAPTILCSAGMKIKAKVKRIFSRLYYAQPAEPQTAYFKANIGAAANAAAKKIYVEVKQ